MDLFAKIFQCFKKFQKYLLMNLNRLAAASTLGKLHLFFPLKTFFLKVIFELSNISKQFVQKQFNFSISFHELFLHTLNLMNLLHF